MDRQLHKIGIKNESQLAGAIDAIRSLEQEFGKNDISDAELLTAFSKEGENTDTIKNSLKSVQKNDNNLLSEIKTKRLSLEEANEKYHEFLNRFDRFEEWYQDYMTRLDELKNSEDFEQLHPVLMEERVSKRDEFFHILKSAQALRLSIFDPSALDCKIEVMSFKGIL